MKGLDESEVAPGCRQWPPHSAFMCIEPNDRRVMGGRVMVSLPASLMRYVQEQSKISGRSVSEILRIAVATVAGFIENGAPKQMRQPLVEPVVKEMSDAALRATKDERAAESESHVLLFRPCAWRVLGEEAEKLSLSREAFLSWLLAFYQNHKEEARPLALPWR